uniref:C2H2-type domain-containing protein n=1 Tax=Stegastes partitus TaxID=144197 RepID=A0A3B5B9I2_9TELE
MSELVHGKVLLFEELWMCQVGEQRLEELPISPVPVKSEDDEGKPQFLQLCGTTESPTSSLAQHVGTEFDGEDFQGSESHLQESVKTSHSSASETEDSDGDWEEFRHPQWDLNVLSNNVISLDSLGDDSAMKSFSCSECGERFAQKGTMQRHKKHHTGEKPFSCTICGKKMTQYHHLVGHMRCHSGEKPFSCSVCHKKFRWSRDVASHVRIHTGEKPHSCSLCGRRFRQHSSLFTHSKSHNEERPLSCLVCNRSREKPYRCTVCGKGFSQVRALNRHDGIHTGEKPCSCCTCGKRFRQQIHVSNHKCVAQQCECECAWLSVSKCSPVIDW